MSLHEPFTEEELVPILEDFYQNGATIIRNVLSREECEQICRRVDQIFAEPYFTEIMTGVCRCPFFACRSKSP